uniref:C2H2-type domain-containing protein n=2 Tax=Lotharella globosa TaxID=91324 RepID=A0A7S3YT58_9EUKA
MITVPSSWVEAKVWRHNGVLVMALPMKLHQIKDTQIGPQRVPEPPASLIEYASKAPRDNFIRDNKMAWGIPSSAFPIRRPNAGTPSAPQAANGYVRAGGFPSGAGKARYGTQANRKNEGHIPMYKQANAAAVAAYRRAAPTQTFFVERPQQSYGNAGGAAIAAYRQTAEAEARGFPMMQAQLQRTVVLKKGGNNAQAQRQPQPPIAQPEQKTRRKELKTHNCTVCGKMFGSKYGLNRHSLIHRGIWPYHCGFCSKKFRQKAHLRNHLMAIHGSVGTEAISNELERHIPMASLGEANTSNNQDPAMATATAAITPAPPPATAAPASSSSSSSNPRPSAPAAPPSLSNSGWVCHVCSLPNPATASHCMHCRTARTNNSSAAPPSVASIAVATTSAPPAPSVAAPASAPNPAATPVPVAAPAPVADPTPAAPPPAEKAVEAAADGEKGGEKKRERNEAEGTNTAKRQKTTATE